MKNKLFGLMLSVSLFLTLVACSKPKDGIKTPDKTESSTEVSKTANTTTEKKEFVYSDIPDDFMSRLEWIEEETKKIPESETMPFETGASLEMFRQLNPEKWTDLAPKTLTVVITVKDCKRCDEYEEMIVENAQKEKYLMDESVGKNKAFLTRFELSNDKEESEKQLQEIADRLGVELSIFNESRPVVLSFAYLKGNGVAEYKWMNTFKAVPREDGTSLSSSVGEEYINKISEVYNQVF